MNAVGAVVAFVVAVGCTQANPAASCGSGTCLDPAFPFCDAEGLISGEVGACIAVSCEPGEVHSCNGDDAITCTDDGRGYRRYACELGCATEPEPHCSYIEPRYLPDICDSAATADSLRITSSGSLDPELDTNCTGGVVAQTGAPSICVLRYRTIEIEAGTTLRFLDTVVGATGRAVALVADDDIAIAGTLDVSAAGRSSGPGGGHIESGGPALSDAAGGVDATGGGGAGGATNGGDGGAPTTGVVDNGGFAAVNPAALAALLGGAGASRADESIDGTVDVGGGGGGGGVTLVSCRGAVRVSGMIDAGGGGGHGGFLTIGGFGGGAGGTVVLQAKTIEITGGIFANGGAGGAGMPSEGGQGQNGEDGSRSSTVSARGGGASSGAGSGGDGGFGTSVPGNGTARTSNATPGGGGGAVGFVQTYTPAGRDPAVSSADASPPFQPNGTLQLR